MRLRLFTSFAFRFALLLCLGCFSQSLLAQQKAQRIALVIGNDSYTKIPALVNARSDARAIAASLQKSGFEVILRTDLNDRGMREAVRLFKARLTGGTEAVFYFSGHGVQVGAGNYLLPVDIAPDSEEQVKDDGLALQKVLDEMAEQKTRFAVAIVDACRDNPFPKLGGRNIGAGKGLSASAPATGQMVLYAAGAGQTALDRLGPNDRTPNGVFTRVLLREMDRPGLPVDRILKNVRQEVVRLAQSVGREQVPALYDQSVGEFYFRGGVGSVASEQKPDAAPVALTEAQREEKFWDDAKAAGNKEGFEAYLESYPRGRYVSLAKANIARLIASVSPPAPSTSTSTTARPNPTAPGLTGVANTQSAAQLAANNACLACHAIDKRIVGPGFKDVAAKYKGNAKAEEMLVQKVLKGGLGVWGPIPMPANARLKPEEAELLVKWILNQ